MKIVDILNNVDNEALALPVFQRGYVWKRRQVKDLMNSLYRGYPVGSLLTWTTRVEQAEVRGDNQTGKSGAIDLLLDGQQRVTSLYGIVRGKPPVFFDGDKKAFSGLYFNLEHEEFEFYAPVKMSSDPLWVSVTDLFAEENDWISRLVGNPSYSQKQATYLQRGLKVGQIKSVDLPIQQVTGDDKTTDVVVDIFNRVNSGGTKLSKGDLTLARIGASWPEARSEMQKRLGKWKQAGFNATLDWLLRCMNAVLVGASEFERLEPEKTGVAPIQGALRQTENAVDHLLEAMRSHLHMDIDRIYNSKQAFPIMVKFLVEREGRFSDQSTMARLFHWYVSVAIWGRFSGPIETVINQDIGALSTPEPIEALLRNLRRSQGDRRVTHDNFAGNYTKARFYPLLYILSRIHDARDWGTGNQLRHHSLGDHTNLELHHIFPKDYLRRNGVAANDANNMGNIAFQTRETNRSIGSTAPVEYMPSVSINWPGALESQWIPMDPELWKVENYFQFLEERRQLLAKAANETLEQLRNGVMPPAETTSGIRPPTIDTQIQLSNVDPENEEEILKAANSFVEENGFSAGEAAYEIYNGSDSEPSSVLDLAWPEGLQEGYSQPVAILIGENAEAFKAASNAGFKVFTTLQDFERYVTQILAE